MRIGLVGRNPRIMESAIATAAELGHAAVGTTVDADAMAWVADGSIEALVIGGGVGGAPRAALIRACEMHGVRVVPVFGPGNLRSALIDLEASR